MFRPLGKEPQRSVLRTSTRDDDKVGENNRGLPAEDQRSGEILCRGYRWICQPVTIWRGILTYWFYADSTGPWLVPSLLAAPPLKPYGRWRRRPSGKSPPPISRRRRTKPANFLCRCVSSAISRCRATATPCTW